VLLAMALAASAVEPAPPFHLQNRWTARTFSNESVKGKVRSASVLGNLVQSIRRGEQPVVDPTDAGVCRSRPRGFLGSGLHGTEKNGQENTWKECQRACKVVLTRDTNLAAMYPTRFLSSLCGD